MLARFSRLLSRLQDDSAFGPRLPPILPAWWAPCLALIGSVALGCTPKIGDACTVSTNCSTSGDRLCDITQPGGYCTVFNCEPGSCPEDSACISFGARLSPVAGCTTSEGNSPYQRSFCMARCSDNGDCRSGYFCLDVGKLKPDGSPDNTIGALFAEHSGRGQVCVANPVGEPVPETGVENGVCSGSRARNISELDAGGAADATDAAQVGAAGASD